MNSTDGLRMILRYWAIVAACMLGLASAAYAQPEGDTEEGNQQQQNAQREHAKPILTQAPIGGMSAQSQAANQALAEAKIYQPNCGKPENQPDADLCTQRRVADATEKALQYTLAQTIIGALGVAFVVVTLGFTARANKAAGIAAQAAVDSVGAERAWMTHGGFQPGSIENSKYNGILIDKGLYLSLVWVNSGRSPAINVSIWSDFKIIPLGNLPGLFEKGVADSDNPQSFAVGSGGSVEGNPVILHGHDMYKYQNHEALFIVWSRIEYGTATTNLRYYSELTAKVEWSGFVTDKNTGKIMPRISISPVGKQNGIGIV